MSQVLRQVARVLAVLAVACGPLDGGEASDEVASPNTGIDLPRTFRRAVIARAYQRGDWTLPGRDPAYVCNVFRRLKPTLVSGLIRLADDDELSADQVDAYRAIRTCVNQPYPDGKIHRARFDVVLNAMQYESPDEIVAKLSTIQSELEPDLWFFDFYQQGYADPKYRPAIEAAIRWIHDQAHGQVGGNVWASDAPPHSDFVAVDDRNGKDKPGFVRMLDQIAALKQKHPGLPVLAHIENNPNKEGNRGEHFLFNWTTAERKAEIEKQAAHQDSGRYWLMYPVFFPLSYRRDGQFAEFEPGFMVAYDASRDGNMIDKFDEWMDAYTNR